MKFLHTADWHLGRTLGGRDLLSDQRHTLEHLVEIAREQRVDAVVIAGDVYDRIQPSEEAINLFSDVLTQLRKVCQVLCIGGNHDSAGRIGFASELLAQGGVFMVGNELGAPKSIDIACIDRPTDRVRFHMMPYATPEEVRSALKDVSIRTHSEAITARVALCELAMNAPNVLVAHLFAQGCRSSDSERDISVGGIAEVDAAAFSQFAYTALGHLHEPHNVRGSHEEQSPARYSGSICRYSFSEEKHEKGVTIVTIDRSGTVTTTQLPLRQTVGMRTICGELEEIVAAANLETPEARASDLVWVELTDTAPTGPAHARVRALYPNMLEFSYRSPTAAVGGGRITEAQLRSESPFEHFSTFFAASSGHLSELEKSNALAVARECLQIATKEDIN